MLNPEQTANTLSMARNASDSMEEHADSLLVHLSIKLLN